MCVDKLKSTGHKSGGEKIKKVEPSLKFLPAAVQSRIVSVHY